MKHGTPAFPLLINVKRETFVIPSSKTKLCTLTSASTPSPYLSPSGSLGIGPLSENNALVDN